MTDRESWDFDLMFPVVDGFNVLRGSLSLGALTAFIQYVRMLFEPVLRLSEGYNVLQGAMASSERIFRLLDEPQEDPGLGTTVESFQARIEFKDVWFAYDKEDWILRGVSFVAEPGQHVAIVGPTGSGKTTIIRILLRMYRSAHEKDILKSLDLNRPIDGQVGPGSFR